MHSITNRPAKPQAAKGAKRTTPSATLQRTDL